MEPFKFCSDSCNGVCLRFLAGQDPEAYDFPTFGYECSACFGVIPVCLQGGVPLPVSPSASRLLFKLATVESILRQTPLSVNNWESQPKTRERWVSSS